jgi:hypothetical protein
LRWASARCHPYTIKAAPAVSHKEILKKLEEAKDFSPAELKKLQELKVRIKVICEAGDLKKMSDVLKELAGNT